jgi:undecaprenyl-diphosphatase
LINLLDYMLANYANQLIGITLFFDAFVLHLLNNELLKGGVLISMIWWLWFKKDENEALHRVSLIITFLGSFIAVFVTRLLVNSLPFRIRPFLNDALTLVQPEGFNSNHFDSLSSFPSDHATLFFALAFGFLAVSKKVGYLALAYTFFLIVMPRVIIGAHYFTDVVAGGLIGMLVVYCMQQSKLVQAQAERIYALETKLPQLFYMVFFIACYQAADLFIHLRNIARFLIKLT